MDGFEGDGVVDEIAGDDSLCSNRCGFHFV
jgi:hypothetical protein